MSLSPPPPLTALTDLQPQLTSAGFAVLDTASLAAIAHAGASAHTAPAMPGHPAGPLGHLASFWDDLPPDAHLRDGGRYRRRRHGNFVVDSGVVQQAPHRAHWQPVSYNALHGGYERWFEPLAPAMAADPAFRALLGGLAGVASHLRPGVSRWFVEAHPFRIDCAEGIGRPTPEGAHRDGVDLVAVVLVARRGVKGGETRVFDARGPQGVRFTLTQPFSALLLDDERVVHETTPIQPAGDPASACRDTLVVTFRQGGFQDP